MGRRTPQLSAAFCQGFLCNVIFESSVSVAFSRRKKLKSTSMYIYQTLFLNGENSDIKICALGEEWNLHKVYLRQVGAALPITPPPAARGAESFSFHLLLPTDGCQSTTDAERRAQGLRCAVQTLYFSDLSGRRQWVIASHSVRIHCWGGKS